MLLGSFLTICTTNPVLMKISVITGLSLLPEAVLKLCSLQSHVLQAVVHLCLDLLALHGKSCQHASLSAINTVPAMSVHCLGLLICHTKPIFRDCSKLEITHENIVKDMKQLCYNSLVIAWSFSTKAWLKQTLHSYQNP